MSKRVVWVHRFGPLMASYRYRAAIPAEEVGKQGFTTAVNDGEADIVVFSKPMPEDLTVAEDAKRQGAKIVMDICDDHFHDVEAETYRKAVEVADVLTCASEVMRHRINEQTQRDAVVIDDPYEQEECAPHADGEDCLWFGHQRNLRELTDILILLTDQKLRVVTGPKTNPGYIPWTPETMKQVFALSHLVLLPTRRGAEYKSPNRLVNSIRAGCFPICMGHPAYQPFRQFVWVGHFPTGLKWVKALRHELNDRVREAQDYVRDRYAPQTIGAQWASLLNSL